MRTTFFLFIFLVAFVGVCKVAGAVGADQAVAEIGSRVEYRCDAYIHDCEWVGIDEFNHASSQGEGEAPARLTAAAAASDKASKEAAAKPEKLVVNPRQGTLEFQTEDLTLKTSFCSRDTMLKFLPIAQGETPQTERPAIGHFGLQYQADGSLSIQLNIWRGESADEVVYKFSDVRAGIPTQAKAREDGSRPAISATYTLTSSPLCLNVNLSKQPPRAVIDKLVKASGISVKGIDTIPETPAIYVNEGTGTAKDLLALVERATGLELVELDATHFTFSKRKIK